MLDPRETAFERGDPAVHSGSRSRRGRGGQGLAWRLYHWLRCSRDAEEPSCRLVVGQPPYRRRGAGKDQDEGDEQPRAPAHSVAGATAIHSGGGLLHSLAARASSASSLGRSAILTNFQPCPAASAAASLIAAMVIEP